MKIDIPIFIIARGYNKEIENRTLFVLPYVYYYINKLELVNRCFVISTSNKILSLAKKLGFTKMYKINSDDVDYNFIEFYGPALCTYDNKLDYNWAIVMPVVACYYDNDLIYNTINKINYNYDVITSYNVIPDISQYLLNDDFSFVHNNQIKNIASYHNWNDIYVIDNAIYCINKDFAEKCVNSTNPRETFWNGKHLFIRNNATFTPVITGNNIYKLKENAKLYNSIQQMLKDKHIDIQKMVNN